MHILHNIYRSGYLRQGGGGGGGWGGRDDTLEMKNPRDEKPYFFHSHCNGFKHG